MKLRRTVRLALWSGEEQGLLGSTACVKATFARPRARWQLKPAARRRCPGYFNVDNGTGAIRGVYLQGNEAIAPIFSGVDGAVQEPRHDDADDRRTPAAPITCRSTRSGMPGFQFVQDPVEHDTRTHHSNYGRIRAAADSRHDEERASSSPRSSTTRRTATDAAAQAAAQGRSRREAGHAESDELSKC